MKKILKNKSESGFTLIELLVVIGIIAILATIGAVNFGSARAKARDAKRISDVKQIQSSVEVDAAGTASGLFPTDVTQQLPADIRSLRAPRTTDKYCYAVNDLRTGYTVSVQGMEDEDNADGDTNPIAETPGININDGAACIIDCAASTTYCLNGSTTI